MEASYTVRRCKPGDDLSDPFSVRTEVFVKEQGFDAALEFDETDPIAHHVVLYDGDEPVATARLFPHGERPGVFVVGRVAALSRCRGGTGRRLMEETEALAVSLRARELMLGAQCRVRGFYEKLGYTAFGEVYYDEHCPHIYMKRSL